MRALLLTLVLVGLFLVAAIGQRRWTDSLLRAQDLARSEPGSAADLETPDGWSMLVVGRPSGTEPLPYPERGWATSDALPSEPAEPSPLSAETEPAETADPAVETTLPDFVYRVQDGDTLGAICAGHYGSSRRALVDSVAAYNNLSSSNAIRAGTLLYLPDVLRL